MNKRGAVIVIIVIILILAVIVTLFFIYNKKSEDTNTAEDEQPVDPIISDVNQSLNQTLDQPQNQSENETTEVENETIYDDFSSVAEIHWNHMPLTYKIENKEECAGKPLDNMEETLEIITTSTNNLVSFLEVSTGEVDIEINCIDGAALLAELNDSITCETTTFDYDKIYIDPLRENLIDDLDFLISVTKVYQNTTENESETDYEICFLDSGNSNAAPYLTSLKESLPEYENNLILNQKINIYKSGSGWSSCATFPARETHEILHTLGFSHSEEPTFDPYYGWPPKDLKLLQDVMFPTLSCKYQKKLDSKYATCLKKIYSNNELEVDGCRDIGFIA